MKWNEPHKGMHRCPCTWHGYGYVMSWCILSAFRTHTSTFHEWCIHGMKYIEIDGWMIVACHFVTHAAELCADWVRQSQCTRNDHPDHMAVFICARNTWNEYFIKWMMAHFDREMLKWQRLMIKRASNALMNLRLREGLPICWFEMQTLCLQHPSHIRSRIYIYIFCLYEYATEIHIVHFCNLHTHNNMYYYYIITYIYIYICTEHAVHCFAVSLFLHASRKTTTTTAIIYNM